jgi:PhnB protein
MPNRVKPIPEGFHTATPFLTVDNGQKALEFYKRAFGAKEVMRLEGPDGKLDYAEIQIGDSRITLSDGFPNMNKSAKALGDSSVAIMLYVEDADKVFKQAVAAGAKEVQPMKDQFFGDRTGSVTDPFGHRWYVCTHIEDVSPEELKRRTAEVMAPAAK